MWDLNSLTRNRTQTPCIGRQSLNHWTAREAPVEALGNVTCVSSLQNPACLDSAESLQAVGYMVVMALSRLAHRLGVFARSVSVLSLAWDRAQRHLLCPLHCYCCLCFSRLLSVAGTPPTDILFLFCCLPTLAIAHGEPDPGL